MSTLATSARYLVDLWLDGSPLPAGHRFESVFRPELVLEDDDVFACELCDGSGSRGGSYGDEGYQMDWGPIDCEARAGGCDGHGLLHGYHTSGEGMPVRIVGPVEGSAGGPAAERRVRASACGTDSVSAAGPHVATGARAT